MALTLEKKLVCLFYNIHDLDIPSPPINISKQLKIGICYLFHQTHNDGNIYTWVLFRTTNTFFVAQYGEDGHAEQKNILCNSLVGVIGRRRFPGSYTYE